jgi:hypothetical protein
MGIYYNSCGQGPFARYTVRRESTRMPHTPAAALTQERVKRGHGRGNNQA